MKVGTDAVLLACWADVRGAKRILDIGTGTGVIALIAAQRQEDAIVDAIDIDLDSIREAKSNFSNSSFAQRLAAVNCDIEDFDKESTYDHILSNPPFFSNGLIAEGSRGSARHQKYLDISKLMMQIKRLLNEAGRASIVLPYSSKAEAIEAALKAGLFLSRLTSVRPTMGAEYKRVLLALSTEQSELKEDELVIEKYGRHKYSEEYIELTKECYLKM